MLLNHTSIFNSCYYYLWYNLNYLLLSNLFIYSFIKFNITIMIIVHSWLFFNLFYDIRNIFIHSIYYIWFLLWFSFQYIVIILLINQCAWYSCLFWGIGQGRCFHLPVFQPSFKCHYQGICRQSIWSFWHRCLNVRFGRGPKCWQMEPCTLILSIFTNFYSMSTHSKKVILKNHIYFSLILWKKKGTFKCPKFSCCLNIYFHFNGLCLFLLLNCCLLLVSAIDCQNRFCCPGFSVLFQLFVRLLVFRFIYICIIYIYVYIKYMHMFLSAVVWIVSVTASTPLHVQHPLPKMWLNLAAI